MRAVSITRSSLLDSALVDAPSVFSSLRPHRQIPREEVLRDMVWVASVGRPIAAKIFLMVSSVLNQGYETQRLLQRGHSYGLGLA